MTAARPRLLFAWEMGANYGHAVKIACVARHLADAAEIFVAAREPAALRAVAPDLPMTLLPAPFARMRGQHPGEAPPENFPAMLVTEGWDRPETLAALIEAWRSLFDLVRPDVLVAQAAPTATVAARGLGMRTAILGGGYDNPPLAVPMPLFDREKGKPEVAARQEAEVLAAVNGALRRAGAPEAARFRDLMESDLSLLVTAQPFDHYGDRAALQPDHPPYLGHLAETARGAALHWAGRSGARIFAYLRPGSQTASAALSALDRLGPENDIILAMPGVPETQAARLAARGVQVCDGPVRLDGILGDCDLGISHASNGIGAAFVTAGVPQIGLPGHREQAMFARAIAKAGLGLGIEGRFGADAVVGAIRHALAQDALRTRVAQVAGTLAQTAYAPSDVAAADALKRLAAARA